MAGRTNAHAIGRTCGAFKSRKDCEQFFFWFDVSTEALDAATSDRIRFEGPPRFGSCGWDSRVRRCNVLPQQKEPCLVAAAGFGGVAWTAPGGETGPDAAFAFTPSREYSKRFET